MTAVVAALLLAFPSSLMDSEAYGRVRSAPLMVLHLALSWLASRRGSGAFHCSLTGCRGFSPVAALHSREDVGPPSQFRAVGLPTFPAPLLRGPGPTARGTVRRVGSAGLLLRFQAAAVDSSWSCYQFAAGVLVAELVVAALSHDYPVLVMRPLLLGC